MMYFWAKVRVERECSAKNLITAFFKEFHPESSITIKGNEAKLEVFFDEPPLKIIEALRYCKIENFIYGKDLQNVNDHQKNVKSESMDEPENIAPSISEDDEPENIAPSISEDDEPENITEAIDGLETVGNTKNSNQSLIPELNELAIKATSVKNFAELIADWLEINQRRDFFENLVILSIELDKVSWKGLQHGLKEKNIQYIPYSKIWCSKHISAKLKNPSVTLLSLMNEVNRFKGYSFNQVEMIPVEENPTENAVKKELFVPKVKMECFPEIPEFEETLGSVDKTQPIEDRVRYVLEAMGLKAKKPQEQKDLVELVTTAVKQKGITLDVILVNSNIPMPWVWIVRMELSELINDFVKRYDSDKKVKITDFISQLQEIIVFEDELEDFKGYMDNE